MMNTKAKPINVQPESKKSESTTPEANPKEPEKTDEKKSVVNPPKNPPQQKPAKDYTNEVKQLLEMGFVKTEAEAAIKAAQGNLSMAIEFLYNGIPSNIPIEEPVAHQGEEGEESTTNTLKRIASIVKILCAQDPSMLQTILLNIQKSDPSLMNMIKENEQEFRN